MSKYDLVQLFLDSWCAGYDGKLHKLNFDEKYYKMGKENRISDNSLPHCGTPKQRRFISKYHLGSIIAYQLHLEIMGYYWEEISKNV